MPRGSPETRSKFVFYLLRIEGLIMLLGSITIAIYFKYAWWLYAGLFFAADISMLAYKKNQRLGAAFYNLTHTTSIPLILLIIGIIFKFPLLVSIMVILLGHIGYDRMNGFGLKYPTEINDTHLHRLSPVREVRALSPVNSIKVDDESDKI